LGPALEESGVQLTRTVFDPVSLGADRLELDVNGG
jgi:hypothetical protein